MEKLSSALLFAVTLSAFSPQAMAIRTDPECTANVHLIDKRELKNHTWQAIDKVPATVPVPMAQIFRQITELPVNASDYSVKRFFTVPPEVDEPQANTKRFVWSQGSGNNEVHLTLTKFRGCISKIVFSYRNPKSKHKSKMESLIQENLVPTEKIVIRGTKDDMVCEIQRVNGQRVTHRIDGRKRYAGEEQLPAFVYRLLRIYHASAIHGKDSLFDYGNPKWVGTGMEWSLKDGFKRDYKALVSVVENCDQKLSISWQDDQGKTHLIERENYLATAPEE